MLVRSVSVALSAIVWIIFFLSLFNGVIRTLQVVGALGLAFVIVCIPVSLLLLSLGH